MARARGMMLYRHDQAVLLSVVFFLFLHMPCTHCVFCIAKYPSIFGVWVPTILRRCQISYIGYLEWGCKIFWGAKYPVTPGLGYIIYQ